MNRDMEKWLAGMHALVCRQHELVPFLRDLHPAAAMQFQPLPAAMRAQLANSPDWRFPEPGDPTVMMLEAGDESGGLLLVSDDQGRLFVLAPA